MVLLTGRALAEKPWSPPDDSWIKLFNGKDFTDWKLPAGEHNWRVVDGVIDYEAKGGDLVSEKKFGDYQLHIEWRFKRTAGDPYPAKVFDSKGNQKRDAAGKPITKGVANADSGIFLRGDGRSQVNLWCWPCGSGQLWGLSPAQQSRYSEGGPAQGKRRQGGGPMECI